MSTLAERLTSIQAAITAIEAGQQSYSIDGISYTRGNLETLYKQEARIEERISREAGKRFTVAEF